MVLRERERVVVVCSRWRGGEILCGWNVTFCLSRVFVSGFQWIVSEVLPLFFWDIVDTKCFAKPI